MRHKENRYVGEPTENKEEGVTKTCGDVVCKEELTGSSGDCGVVGF